MTKLISQGKAVVMATTQAQDKLNWLPEKLPICLEASVAKQVVVDVSGEPYMNLEHEAQMALIRD